MGSLADQTHGSCLSLAGSQEVEILNYNLIRTRTFSLSARIKFHASATSAARANFYFSPDGDNYDSVPYTYFDINLTAGAVVQETHLIDTPEKGFIKVAVKNLDAVYPITGINTWITSTFWR